MSLEFSWSWGSMKNGRLRMKKRSMTSNRPATGLIAGLD
jgi:hypothetical protein